MLPGSLPPPIRSRGVTAVLGPTNTGKTHLAIERMLGHSSGIIGVPLRLLAREVYGRLVDRVGKEAVALVTGEEKIKPDTARYWVSTTEAMPRDLDVSFVAIDEIQLAADADRGHVFTDALLNRRGRGETMLIGASTMRPLVEALLPGAVITTRPRLSKLTFAGERKITRLPPRSAIVAFSAEEVYAIAELLRRQVGGAAVVMGALSPRTRNAQVDMYQSGDVDHIVATDAIGMGLNLDINHVAFAGDRKFDGSRHRRLVPGEFGQIAGRAGRHLRDGTFGTAGRCPPFDLELVEALENHTFEALRCINWRNPNVDFSSLQALSASLAILPDTPGLARAPTAEDELTLDIAVSRPEIRDLANGRAAVTRLWEMCQLPDYRKVAPHHHADLVATLYEHLMRRRHIPADWFAREVAVCDRTDGDIDTLSQRLAQVRTWTFCANRSDWLADPEHWQATTRGIEDKLSDALHEKLAQRFVDRRTSVLMRRLRENAMLEAMVTAGGDVLVEGQHVGHLQGFRFTGDPAAMGADAKALHAAAARALATEIEARALRLQAAPDDAFALALDGTLRWIGEPVGKMQAGDKALEPRVILLADEQLNGVSRDGVEARLALWVKSHIARLLGPLIALETGDALTGIGRGIAFQVAENLGVVDRAVIANDVKALDQAARGELRKLGVRFGAYHIYLPNLMKPAPRSLAAQLWMLKHGGIDRQGLDEITHLASSGRTSIPVDAKLDKALYRTTGYRVCGGRAVRVDILERLADIIRPAIAYRPGITQGEPPPGTFDGDGFTVTVSMTSLVGCSGEEFASILKSLGYRVETRPAPVKPSVGEPPEPAPATSADILPAPEVGAEMQDAGAPKLETVAEAAMPAPEVAAALEPEPDASTGAAPDMSSADAQAETTATTRDETPVEAAPAEPVTIEVWRPGRFERPERRPQRDGGPQAEGSRREGAGHGGGFNRSRQERGPGQRREPAAPAAGAAARDTAGSPSAEQQRPPREGGQRGGPRRFENRFERPAGHQGDRPAHARGEDRGRGRGDRQNDRHQDRQGEQATRAPRPEKQPDPDSPFAKLLELKQRMDAEKGKK